MKLLFAISLMLSACAPKAIIIDPIAPTATRVKAASEASALAAKRVGAGAAEVQRQASELQADIIKGMLAADRIRKAGMATPEELDANAEAWRKVSTRNLFLEAAAEKMVIDTTDLEATTTKGLAEASKMESEAIKTDKNTAALNTQVVKLEDDAGKWRALRSIIIGSIIIFVIVGGFLLYLRLT